MYSLVIVDDESEQREGLSQMFPWNRIGFQVEETFASARDALAYFSTNKADVLVTDIRMPFMSGLELIRHIKETNPACRHMVCCILSAWRDFGYAQEAMSLGVRHYLVKPTDFVCIEETFGKIRMELDNREPILPPIPDGKHPLVSRAILLMNTDPANCTLQSIARQLGVSQSYLSRLFKEETGENFQNALQTLKMKQAADMLSSSRYHRIRSIALSLGYRDAQNFCRTFRKCHGMTPGEYRRKCGRT